MAETEQRSIDSGSRQKTRLQEETDSEEELREAGFGP